MDVDEKTCQASLLYELRHVGFHVSSEYHIGNRRIDLLVDQAVGIEMKTRLRGSSAGDRAKSQIRRYARLCGQKGFSGPVLGVFVHTDPSHPVVREVAEDIGIHNAAVLKAPTEQTAKIVHLFTVGEG